MLSETPFDPLHSRASPQSTPKFMAFICGLATKMWHNVFVVLRFSPFRGQPEANWNDNNSRSETKQLRNIYLRCTAGLGSLVLGQLK